MCTLERTFEAVNMKVNKYINRTIPLQRSSMKFSLGTWGGGGERYVGVAICVRTSGRVIQKHGDKKLQVDFKANIGYGVPI
jgi:hypothetical protein